MISTRTPFSPSYSRNTATASRNLPLPRHQHRDRDFGVGYGNSSGYASNKRYAPTGNQALFRCA